MDGLERELAFPTASVAREPNCVTGNAVYPGLTAALESITPPGVLTAHRLILPGDEEGLLPEEQAAFRKCVLRVSRQSGAARIVARHLLAVRGFPGSTLLRSASGAPTWPPGVVGSLAHGEVVAVTAIAMSHQFSALGIDVEPPDPLPQELVTLVATAAERARYGSVVLESRLLFVIKEAIYKALNPLDGVFLDFHDIEVDLPTGQAETRTGYSIAFAFTLFPCVLAISFRKRSADC